MNDSRGGNAVENTTNPLPQRGSAKTPWDDHEEVYYRKYMVYIYIYASYPFSHLWASPEELPAADERSAPIGQQDSTSRVVGHEKWRMLGKAYKLAKNY